MKIVILDGYTLNPGDLTWEGLSNLGELTVYDRTPDNMVIERIGGAEAVFVNKIHITRDIMDKTNLKFIGVFATGYDIVDIKAAREKGIVVTNIPAYGTDSVAQMAIAHLLEICSQVGLHDRAVKNGDWTNNPDWSYCIHPMVELAGKTIGIIGYGRIGQAVGRIAEAFGMRVLAYNRNPKKDLESETMKYVNLDELLEKSDVISLHCPLREDTRGIINKDTIFKMKDGVIIINTSRGALVVEEDLAAALNRGKVYAAGLDVASSEPINEGNPLLKAKNIFITPHIAWAPREARERLMGVAINNLKAFMEGKPVNVVNK